MVQITNCTFAIQQQATVMLELIRCSKILKHLFWNKLCGVIHSFEEAQSTANMLIKSLPTMATRMERQTRFLCHMQYVCTELFNDANRLIT